MHRSRHHLLLLAVVAGFSLVGCNGDSSGRGHATADPDTGPLALIKSEGSDDASFEGTLRITEECTFLRVGGNDTVLGWPADRTEWADGKIRVTNLDGGSVTLTDGEKVKFGGGSDSAAESGRSNQDWLDLDWVTPPDATCARKQRVFVHEVGL